MRVVRSFFLRLLFFGCYRKNPLIWFITQHKQKFLCCRLIFNLNFLFFISSSLFIRYSLNVFLIPLEIPYVRGYILLFSMCIYFYIFNVVGKNKKGGRNILTEICVVCMEWIGVRRKSQTEVKFHNAHDGNEVSSFVKTIKIDFRFFRSVHVPL